MSGPILDSLSVWWGQRIAGTLSIDRGGAMHFAYAPDWLTAPDAPDLSRAMPKREAGYDDAICKAVFGGLLPEEGQRTAIVRRSEEPTSELQSLMRTSYAVFCLKQKIITIMINY